MAFQHKGDGCPAGVKAGIQIDSQNPVPLTGCHVRKQSKVCHACVIYQHIQMRYVGKQPGYVCFHAHIRQDGHAADPICGLQVC
jgi:hypothetical protein